MTRSLQLSFLLFALSPIASAQQPDWLVSWSVNWNLNPGMPRHVLEASPGGNLMTARLDGSTLSFGTELFGNTVVHRLDPGTGQPLWSCGLFPTVNAECGVVDDSGFVYVAGQFMDGIQLCDGSILGHTGSGFDVDLFLMKFDPNGILVWSRNLSPAQPNASNVAALAFDPGGALWYATSDFILTRITRVDALGNDVETRYIDGGKTIGGMSFDPAGGLYVSGGCDNNAFAFGGAAPTLPANDPYLMFLCRFKPDGTADWSRFAHDITFQFPEVVADANGNAYLAGSLFDSTAWGGFQLNGPDWGQAMFLMKVDSTGSFQWAVESDPTGLPITGDLAAADRGCLAVDGTGNPCLTGTLRGTVDWGNGVVSNGLTLGVRTQTIVAFDANGTPQWAGTSSPITGFTESMSITAMSDGTIHFSAHVNGQYDFAPHTANTGGAQAFVLGRISNPGTGTIEDGDAAGLVAYPSPFNDRLSLHPAPDPTDRITVTDATGRVVHSGSFTATLGQNWPPGLYAVEVRNAAERSVIRVVKE